MKSSAFFMILVGLIASTLYSCSLFPGVARCKTSILSQYGGVVQVSVYLEGTDGNYVTGAQVLVTSPAGAVQTLGFDTQKGCYHGYFGDLLSGIYSLDLHSTLLPEAQNLSINHQIPESLPLVTECSDAAGNNALISQSLKASETITLRWSAVSPCTAYTIQINQGAIQAYSAGSSSNSLVIPAGTLGVSRYSAWIAAQWIDGDPYLLTSDFYSASQSQGSSFLFTVQ